MFFDLHQKYDEYCKEYSSIDSDKWFPHVGIWYTSPDIAKSKLPILIDNFEELKVMITHIRITSYENGTFVSLGEFPLSGMQQQVYEVE